MSLFRASPRSAIQLVDLLGDPDPGVVARRLRRLSDADRLAVADALAVRDWWTPNHGPQRMFLLVEALEVLYGGAAGGGKSEALLMAAIEDIDLPDYRAVLFRRTFPDLKRSLIDRSQDRYPAYGGVYNATDHVWSFPSGARILFAHLEHEKSVTAHQSAEYQFIGFDELTHFLESQYRYMLTRARTSKAGRRVRIRAATNPGGIGHEWVFRRWGPWLDPKSSGLDEPDAKPALAPGEIAWVRDEEMVPEGTPDALSRTFIPARIHDNPHLLANDPNYVAMLKAQDAVTRAQLLDGNWLAKPAAGLYFKRSMVKVVEDAPRDIVQVCRYWDLAGSARGDYTAGLLMGMLRDRRVVVLDCVRFRGSPAEVRTVVQQTAKADGRAVPVYIEQDPGQAGKDQVYTYSIDMQGYAVFGRTKRSDKLTAFQPFSAQAEAGNVVVVAGRWNRPWFETLEEFPDGAYDDAVDATSGAFTMLTQTPPRSDYAGALVQNAAPTYSY